MARTNKGSNDFESFLNECNTYVWEWYLPEQFVRFGIPSLNGLWIDDKEKIFKLSTVLERVHPDDVDKIFVRRNSPLYKSDTMFEVDLRLNLTGTYEWYGFRGKTLKRNKQGRPIYVRGVAINIDNRIRAQRKLLSSKDYQLQNEKQKTDYCAGVMQEVVSFIRSLASNADSIITGDDHTTREERLLKLNDLKEQVARILDLTDKVKRIIGDNELSVDKEIKKLALWEHLAELQQIYSLKMPGVLKLYFSNLYDDLTIDINVKLFDLLIENVINSQIHNTRNGYLMMNYSVKDSDTLQLVITCTENEMSHASFEVILTESGLGLSVCRLLAKRLWGDIEVVQTDENKMQYVITLPLNARKESHRQNEKLDVFSGTEENPDDGMLPGPEMKSGLPKVLIGIHSETGMFRNQHLFDVVMAQTTDEVLSLFTETNPDIVFFDYNLKGSIPSVDLIARIRNLSHDTPLILTADYAHRLLHKRVRALGVQYLLNNPLSLRKVNVMIKKYLK